ncbi:MAG: hypothetical protein RLZZ450_5005 [Pseudomonadota bacterium]
MQVWGKSGTYRVYSAPQACNGSFTDDAYEPFECLDPVMEKLGFHQPVTMGDRCRVYEREDATMTCKGSLDNDRTKYRFYDLGASNEATIRSILGTIARETRLLVKLDEWKPPLHGWVTDQASVLGSAAHESSSEPIAGRRIIAGRVRWLLCTGPEEPPEKTYQKEPAIWADPVSAHQCVTQRPSRSISGTARALLISCSISAARVPSLRHSAPSWMPTTSQLR